METNRRRCDLAGLTLAVEATSAESELIADRHFGRLPISTRAPDITITIRHGPADERVRGDHDRRTTAAPERRIASMRVAGDDDLLGIVHDRGGHARCTPSSIDVTVDAADGWLVARQLFSVGLTWTLGHHERTTLHSALVSRGAQSILVLGGTGQGKSTAAVAAAGAGHGWAVHADDLIVVDNPTNGTCRAWGLPKPLTIEPGPAMQSLADIDPDLAASAEPLESDARGRAVLPTTTLAHDATQPIALILVGHDDGPGRLDELSASFARQALIRAHGLADDPIALRRSFATLVALSSLPTFTLGHAADPLRRVAAARAMLDDVFARSTSQPPQ